MTEAAPDLIARLRRLATSTLANALDDVGLIANAAIALRPVAPAARLVGPAVTVKQLTGEYGSFESADFKVGDMIDAAGPGDVLVVDSGGAPYSTWGGTASFAAKTKGIAGLVVDGAVRDREEIEALGFPVFARHVVPTTGRRRLKVEAINIPVGIDGVVVAPGDLLVADGSGIVCLPRDQAADLAARAEAMAADDEAAIGDLKAGLTFSEAMAKYKKI